MRASFESYGRPRSRARAPGFATIVRIIVDQQVSVQAGAAIWARLDSSLNGDITAEAVIRAGQTVLRQAGLSGPKASYVAGIAECIAAGELDLDKLHRRPDDVVRAELTALRGVGEWTADIYLMFAMGRRDIFPVGDVALQAAAGRLLQLPERPKPDELRIICERWRPYRSVAAVALWHFYKKMPARG